jgi:hypothetical protein
MPGDLITRERQYQLGDLLLGPGTPYIVQSVEGLGVPATITHDIDDPADDGDVEQEDEYFGPRNIDISLGLYDDHPHPDFHEVVDALVAEMSAVRGELTEFAFRFVGRPVLFCRVRPRRYRTAIDPVYHKGMTFAVLQLYGPRPHILAADEQSEAITLAGGVNTGQSTFAVGGTYPTKPIITVEGPARNPRLTHTGLGRALRVDIDIQTGEKLVFDAWSRTVRLEGENVYDTVRWDNEWWELLKGSNTVQYARSSTALNGATSTATIAWRDARMGV